jgi:hypothetical protein
MAVGDRSLQNSLVFGDIANTEPREIALFASWMWAQAAEHKRAAV